MSNQEPKPSFHSNIQSPAHLYDTTKNQLLEDASYTYTYAPQGHFLSGSRHSRGNLKGKVNKATNAYTYYTFNGLNQLTAVYTANQKDEITHYLKYEYAPQGYFRRLCSGHAFNRRVSKEENTVKHYYLYAPQGHFLAGSGHKENIIAILDKNKNTLATIVHHPTLTDTPLSITNVNGTFYYHEHPKGISSFQSGHHQGSIIALTDEHGQIVESIEYDNTYGKVLKHTKQEENLTLNPYGYTGREMDAHDLYYYRARYYDPNTQRFLSLDPIGFEAGDFNFYRYVGNDPVNYVDPGGTDSCECKLIRATESKWKHGKDGRYKTWKVNGEDTGKKTNSFEYYNGKSPGDKAAQGVGKAAVNGVQFVKDHPDSVGLGLSIGAAALEGPFAVAMGLGAIAIDVCQGDEVGERIGEAALFADTFVSNPKVKAAAIGVDIVYGIGQLF